MPETHDQTQQSDRQDGGTDHGSEGRSRRDLLRATAAGAAVSAIGLPATTGSVGAAPRTSEDHRFLFWNTWLLDGVELPTGNVAAKPDFRERSAEIGQALDEVGYDVIGLCEVFDSEERDRIEDNMDREVRSRAGPDGESIWPFGQIQLSGGKHTLLAGRGDERRFVRAHERVFDDRGGKDCDADAWSNKGVLHTEINLGPGNVDLFTTHMFAGGGLPWCDGTDADREAVRSSEMQDLRETIREHARPENVTVVAGDFNIQADTTEYLETIVPMLDEFDLVDLWARDHAASGGTGGTAVESASIDTDQGLPYHATSADEPGRIDYVFVQRPKPSHAIELDLGELRRATFWRELADPGQFSTDDGPNYLSDHMGLDADMTVRPTEPVYRIESAHSGKVLDVSGVSTDDGATIHQWGWWDGPNQYWRIQELGDGTHRIQSVNSGKAIDVSGASGDDGADVHQWGWHGGDNQRWYLDALGDGTYRIRAKHSGKVLDVSGYSTEDGGNVHQWEWHGNANQRWRLETVYAPS